MNDMPTIEDVRVILERTFGIPVAESDAKIVLDRLSELQAIEVAKEAQRIANICRLCGKPESTHTKYGHKYQRIGSR